MDDSDKAAVRKLRDVLSVYRAKCKTAQKAGDRATWGLYLAVCQGLHAVETLILHAKKTD